MISCYSRGDTNASVIKNNASHGKCCLMIAALNNPMLCLSFHNNTSPAGRTSGVPFRLAHSSTTRKLTAFFKGWKSWRISRVFARWPPACTDTRARGGWNPPSLSVPASPGSLRSNRAGAASGGSPSRSAAWRVRPPWVPQPGHRARTKGRWGIRGTDTPSPYQREPWRPANSWGDAAWIRGVLKREGAGRG